MQENTNSNKNTDQNDNSPTDKRLNSLKNIVIGIFVVSCLALLINNICYRFGYKHIVCFVTLIIAITIIDSCALICLTIVSVNAIRHDMAISKSKRDDSIDEKILEKALSHNNILTNNSETKGFNVSLSMTKKKENG